MKRAANVLAELGIRERDRVAIYLPMIPEAMISMLACVPPTGERFDRLEDQLAIITGLWSTPIGERFSYSGTHYSIDDSPRCPSRCSDRVRRSSWAGSVPSARRSSRRGYADEFNVAFAPPDAYPEIVGRVAAACEAIGRDPASLPTSIANTVLCGADDAEVAPARRGHRA